MFPSKSSLYSLVLCWLFLSSSLLLQAQNILFEHLTVKDGLSQSTVNSIYQDEFDVMWIGTKDGLNKYDGNKFEVFKPVKEDTLGLFGNNIQTVTGDKQGRLYLQCLWGLVEYDLVLQRFKTITRSNVVAINYGLDNLWVCDNNSIQFYDKEKEALAPYHHFKDNIRITTLKETTEGMMYIGTRDNGLLLLDKNKKTKTLIPAIEVVNIYEDSNKNIWVGSLESGLFKIERSGHITNFRHTEDTNSISSNFVRTICEDNLGKYWIGTSNGLNRLDPNSGLFTVYKHSEDASYSIGSSSIWDIQKDNQGTLWIGTYFGGLDIFNPEFSFFKYYKAAPNELSASVVGKMTEDKEGNLWVCTEGGGLNFFDLANNTIHSYKLEEAQKSISSNILKALWYDEARNCIWVGAHLGGLSKFDIATKTFIKYPHLILKYPGFNDIRSIVHHKGILYLGTKNSVLQFDIEKETIAPLLDDQKYALENKQIWNMMIDIDEHLWFSTSFAVFQYDIKNGTVNVYTHNSQNANNISQNYQNTFFQDHKGRIWLGSAGSGLDLYDPKTDTFTSFNTSNSDILDDYILDINESKMGYLLIATNKGLSRFDVENKHFYNYSNNDMFPFTAINERGLYVKDDGKIFIGGINGMIEIDEQDLNLFNKGYSIHFSDLWINNQRVLPNDKTNILNKSIAYTDEITLDHTHTSVLIEFATTNYVKVLKEDIYYKLEGFDNEWIHANQRNAITYTNLNPGKYVLRVKDKAHPNEAALSIIVKAPFYKTWEAYLIYFILIVAITYGILANYISSIKLKTALKYSIKEKQQIEELNKAKLRFFTNISHEFRTPLTLIISQVEMLFQRDPIPRNIQQKLSSISRNATKMQRLIGELLDFNKQEQGLLQLHIEKVDIIAFLNTIYLSFKDYALSKNIHLIFVGDGNLPALFDTKQMEKVFYNLLLNAIKHTSQHGTIIISIEQHDFKTVNIAVKDNGIGMDEDVLDKIFDRFYQVNNGNHDSITSTGIGLSLTKEIVEAHQGQISVKSKKGEGSEFTVTLLLDNEYLKTLWLHNDSKAAVAITEAPEHLVPEIPFTEEIGQMHKSTSRSKSTILIVEDNEELLSVLSKIFKPVYNVLTANNGHEGLQKTIDLQPDIVLSDVVMPEMTGTAMCHKIKTNMDTCHIPVVLLTAQVTTEQTISGLQQGADDYITKPFNAKILITKCHNLVNGRRVLQTKFSKSPNAEANLVATNTYDQELLQRAMTFIEDNLDNPSLDIALFAQEMNLGRTNLYAKIKGITGQTPNNFIMNIRLKKSVHFLTHHQEFSVSEIAYKVGFSEPAYYIKCFKKLFGHTPAQYRKKHLMESSKE